MHILLYLHEDKIPFLNFYKFPQYGTCPKCEKSKLFISYDPFFLNPLGYCFDCQAHIDLFQYIVFIKTNKYIPIYDAFDWCVANGIVDGAFCDLFEKYCRRFNEIETNKILFSKIKCLAQDKDILKELGVFGLKCNDPKAILQIAIPFTEQIAERLNVDITQRGEGGFIIPFYSSPGVIVGYFDLISPSSHRFKYICYYATGCSFSNINFIYDRNSLTRIYQWYLITDDPLLYIRSHIENYNKYKKFLPLSLFYKFFKLPFQHAFVHIPADIKLLYLRTKDYTSYSVLLCNIYNAYVLPVSENCTLSVSQ
ncbi:MAG: hypothetical protein QXQ37_07160, partial [Nitrososphaerota archaeon]